MKLISQNMKKFYIKSISKKQVVTYSFLIGSTFVSLLSNAQPYLNNNGAGVHIATGTFLNIDGSFENQTSGVITNKGTLEVSGDWENNDINGVFASNEGIVFLDGAAQNIKGSEITFFNNLTLAGTSNKTLQIDTKVGGGYASPAGILSLTDKTLILGIPGSLSEAHSLDITNPLTTAITYNVALGIPLGHIKSETQPSTTLSGTTGPGYSPVKWDISNNFPANPTIYKIPFTNAAGEDLTFTYAKTTAGTEDSPGSGYMGFATYPSDNPQNQPWPEVPSGPLNVNHIANDAGIANHFNVIDRFWIVSLYNSGYTSAGRPKSKMVFKWSDTDWLSNNGGIVETDLRPQRFNPFGSGLWGDWLWGPEMNAGNMLPTINPGVDGTANTLQISIANEYDYFEVWTLVDESNPLPIELIRFAAECNNGQVAINWTTASETNNDFFTVQRSLDGTTFEDVTIVDGAGNSNSIINYSSIDYSPFGGTSYYRLKQTDFDGNVRYSDVVAVSCADAITDFNLVNAYDQGNGTMAVVFNAGNNELYTITLFDARGRQVTNTTGKAYSGKNQISIPVGDLATGIYLINLSNEFKSFGRRVLLH